jgi:general stress protein YciG
MTTTKKGTIKNKEFFAAIGRKGGLTTKRRKLADNPNYYAEIGVKGGEIMKKTRGKEFYSRIGKMGKRDNSAEPQSGLTDSTSQQ